jgi:hypothetical protein
MNSPERRRQSTAERNGTGRRTGPDDRTARTMAVRDKIFAAAKGFRGRAKNCIKTARDRVHKAWQYQYRDRRTKKREYRRLWITRINAATREHGVRGKMDASTDANDWSSIVTRDDDDDDDDDKRVGLTM